ncbi:ATP-binding protein [Brachyspira hyodysenteriae]|uniref:ATP-binding protein n=1 Tax=Brachyspira hyodysenteriae TaxID=159 RepID=UPI00063DA8DF|nr:ATP-binding protein [Brachyspira hyodysenteriae]KLI29269.1 ATP-binding protein [Brachyspira hyodysenteriae]MCZ9982155.1 ATP-binding protein [Brachyspira hyodysenteriae]MDA0064053.1 ATP-binding protein [Brachyspira hyodysenteriae]MDA0067126.1 ATP-binding protein [Brachyspira hyodysenteriae]MDA0072201.1 ATP-binding protein [Brachyspira hyodysenteriae]
MNKFCNAILLSAFLFAVSCSNNAEKAPASNNTAAAEPTKKEAVGINVEGLAAPESVKFKNGKLYIANLGDPNAPADGFIIVANEDGSNPQKLFEGQLDSPKGFSFLTDDIIIIPDQVNDSSMTGNLVLANVKENKIITKLPIEGSKFLNDTVVIDPTTVALTDTGASTVHFVKVDNNSALSITSSVPEVVGANGILLDNGVLYIAGSTFGGDANGGDIYTLKTDGTGLTKWTASRLGAGALDGIAIANGKLYVSDWGENGANNNACIYIFDLNTKEQLEKIEGSLSGVADIDLVNNVIYIPELSTSLIKKVQL